MRKIVEMRKVPACEEQQLIMTIIMLIKKKYSLRLLYGLLHCQKNAVK